MSTLQRLFFGNVYGYCEYVSNPGPPAVLSQHATDGTFPPSELSNAGDGQSRGCVWVAKKDTFITAIAVHNCYGADAELMIAQTPGGVFYDPAKSPLQGHHLRTPLTGVTIPAGQSYDVIVGKYYSLAGTEGLIFLTNISILGLSALKVDVIGESN